MMALLMLLRIFSDCCVYFAIMTSGPITLDVPVLLLALIFGATAAVGAFFEKIHKPVLRRISAVLPLFCLFFGSGLWQVLILVIPAAYTAIVIWRGKLDLDYYGYRHVFKKSLLLLGGAFLAAHAWIFMLQITNTTDLQIYPNVILRYGLVHLVCGIILQRQLRLGVGSRAEGGKQQVVALLGTALVIIVVCLVAEPLLRTGMQTVLGYVLSVVMTPFAFVIHVGVELFTRMKNFESDKQDYEAFLDHLENVGLAAGEKVEQTVQVATDNSVLIEAVWLGLVGVVLAIAAVLLVRTFYKRGAMDGEGLVQTPLVTTQKKKKAPAFSNRAKVRQMYREFLRAEHALGLRLKVSDTSADVLARIHRNTDRPSAEMLRNVYLRARYDERQSISRDQVEQAKQALKGTRKAKT